MTAYYFLRQGSLLQRITLEGDPPGVAQVLEIGAIEPNCKINVSFNLHRWGSLAPPSVFCHEQTTGNIFYYYDDAGAYKRSETLGAIGSEWELQVFQLPFNPSGEFSIPQIFGHCRSTDPRHPGYQEIRIWNVPEVSKTTSLGRIGTEWDLMLGDFNGNGFLDILGRRKVTNPEGKQGDLRIFFTNGSRVTGFRDSGNIGLEWKIQVADMNGDGRADLFGHTANNDLWVWHNVEDDEGPGRFSEGKSYGKFGTEWRDLQVTYLRDLAKPIDILGISNTGEIRGWFTDGSAILSNDRSIGSAPGWKPIAWYPKSRTTT